MTTLKEAVRAVRNLSFARLTDDGRANLRVLHDYLDEQPALLVELEKLRIQVKKQAMYVGNAKMLLNQRFKAAKEMQINGHTLRGNRPTHVVIDDIANIPAEPTIVAAYEGYSETAVSQRVALAAAKVGIPAWQNNVGALQDDTVIALCDCQYCRAHRNA